MNWSDEVLDDCRLVGDANADGLVATLLAEHPGTDRRLLIPELLGRLGDGGAPELGRWLREVPPLPDWADPAKLDRARRLFDRFGLQICSCLFAASLPWDYAASKGADILAIGSDLVSGDIRRRIAETGQFLLDVHQSGDASLESGGQADRSVRGVRLVHAAARVRVHDECPDVVTRLGAPLNQEDLAGTMLSFGTVVLDALPRLGMHVDDEDREAYVHLWAMAGHRLGIDEALLPRTYAEGSVLQQAIERRHHAASDGGRRLMAALLVEMESTMPLGLRRLPSTMIHHAIGHETAGLLGVPRPAWWSPIVSLLAWFGRRITRMPGARRVTSGPSRLLGRFMIRRYIDAGMAGTRPRFRVSDEQMRRWRVGEARARRRLRERRRRIRLQRLTGGNA